MLEIIFGKSSILAFVAIYLLLFFLRQGRGQRPLPDPLWLRPCSAPSVTVYLLCLSRFIISLTFAVTRFRQVCHHSKYSSDTAHIIREANKSTGSIENLCSHFKSSQSSAYLSSPLKSILRE